MLNIVLNPLTALFRKTFYKMSKYDDALSLTKSLFKEAQNAAKLCGVDIADEEYDKITARCKENVTFKSSMYQDIEANRNPEIDAILGVVVRTHEKHNQQAPYSDCLLKIMNVKYGGWFQISPTLAADVLVINNDKVLLIDRKNEPLGRAQLPHSQIIGHNAAVTSDFVGWLKKQVPEVKSSQFVYDPVRMYCVHSDFTIIVSGS